MASIEEFINRRYIDAKEEVRRLDGDFVNEFESAVRLNSIGLEPPRLVDTLRKPRQRPLKRMASYFGGLCRTHYTSVNPRVCSNWPTL